MFSFLNVLLLIHGYMKWLFWSCWLDFVLFLRFSLFSPHSLCFCNAFFTLLVVTSTFCIRWSSRILVILRVCRMCEAVKSRLEALSSQGPEGVMLVDCRLHSGLLPGCFLWGSPNVSFSLLLGRAGSPEKHSPGSFLPDFEAWLWKTAGGLNNLCANICFDMPLFLTWYSYFNCTWYPWSRHHVFYLFQGTTPTPIILPVTVGGCLIPRSREENRRIILNRLSLLPQFQKCLSLSGQEGSSWCSHCQFWCQFTAIFWKMGSKRQNYVVHLVWVSQPGIPIRRVWMTLWIKKLR